MEIKLQNTPEQVELIKCMGSKNSTVAREATEAVAAFLGPVIKEVLQTAGNASRIYRDIEFDEDSDPSIPLDLFYNEGAGYVTVWSQSMAGGMPTSQVEGIKELKFGTYRLDTAVSFNKKYARKCRLDVISKAIEQMVQNMLIKQERNAWAVALKAVAEASTTTVNTIPGGSNPTKHVLYSATDNVLLLSDVSKMLTRMKRINESFSGNTATQPYSAGITDLFLSPEIKAQVRAFSYNPINTTASAASAAQTVRDQVVTESMREEIYRNAGMQSIFGINLIEMVEFGLGQKYNTLFGTFAAQQSLSGGGGTGSFATATDEVLLGIDNTRGVLLRPVVRNGDTGGTFTVVPDGQFEAYGSRVEKVGFYGSLEEGRLCIDARALQALIV